jgi:predicted DNA-binding mobile mystery protein A
LDPALVAQGIEPHKDWIRAIRDALGMSSTELATRIGMSQQSVSQMERGEQRNTITMETLRRAANALAFDLVYVLEPRTTLDEAVRGRAHEKAARHLAPLAHHHPLEDQTLTADDEYSTPPLTSSASRRATVQVSNGMDSQTI